MNGLVCKVPIVESKSGQIRKKDAVKECASFGIEVREGILMTSKEYLFTYFQLNESDFVAKYLSFS